MENDERKFVAEKYREFIIFFAIMFFTCVVGIMELLTEFDKIGGIFSWSWISISAIYFGFLSGTIYSMVKCFWLYKINREYLGKFGFIFWEIEPYDTRGKMIRNILIVVFLLFFTVLYLVKIGFLK